MKLWGLVAMAQGPDLKSASGYPKMVQKQATGWIERAAEKMPEDEYAFPAGSGVAVVPGDKNPSPGFNASHNLEHYGNLAVYAGAAAELPRGKAGIRKRDVD